jgi:hypothetical protein
MTPSIAELVLALMEPLEESAEAAERRAGVAPGHDGYTGGGWAPRHYPDGSWIGVHYSREEWAADYGEEDAAENYREPELIRIGLAAYKS